MDRRLEHLFLRFRRKGDPRALAKVFDLSAVELATIARQLVHDAATAEDIVQATYLTAIEKAHAFDERQKVMPWLIGILARHAARARTSASRTPDPARVTEPPTGDPADDAQNAELGSLITERIDELPEEYASAVRSYLTEGRRPREIAGTLGITPNAASVRLHRGLALLRKRLPSGAAPAIIVAMPDLALVRENVLASLTTPQVAASGVASAALATGVLTMKKSILLVAVGALLGSGATHLLSPSVAPPPARAKDSVTAHVPLDAVEEQVILTTPDRREASRSVVPAGAQPTGEPAAALTADEWLARILACENARAAEVVFAEIAALDPAEGRDVMQSVWIRIPAQDYRESGMRVFLSAGHRFVHAILHLGATDASVTLQADALRALSTIAFQGFAANFDEYLAWHARNGERTYQDVLRDGAIDFGGRATSCSDADLLALFRRFDSPSLKPAEAAGVDLRSVLVGAGVPGALERLMESGADDALRIAVRWARALQVEDTLLAVLKDWLASPDTARQVAALRWMGSFEADTELLRDGVLAIVQDRDNRDAAVVEAAVGLLGRPGNDFAVDTLLDVLLNPAEGTGRFFSVSRALGKIGDPRAIPTMIAVIRADDTYSSVYGVGYFGLTPLTGVPYSESHDGAFWVKWWGVNRARLPESVHGMSIPFVSF